MTRARSHHYPVRTEGASPKAQGAAVGSGVGWALSQVALELLPKASGTLAAAVTILVTAAVAYAGAWIPRPGVVVHDDEHRLPDLDDEGGA